MQKEVGITERSEDTDDADYIPEGPEDEAALSDAFTKELVKNMQDLMRELADEKTPKSDKGNENKNEETEEGEAERLMKAAWEAMLIEGMNGMTEPPPLPSTSKSTAASTSASGGGAASGAGSDFQSKIKQTMEKLKESEVNLQACDSSFFCLFVYLSVHFVELLFVHFIWEARISARTTQLAERPWPRRSRCRRRWSGRRGRARFLPGIYDGSTDE